MATTVIANGQHLSINTAGRLSVLVPQQGIRVDVQDAVEISFATTTATMKAMSERAWQHVSTGELFTHLFGTLFPGTPVPKTVADLNAGDEGVAHGAGLIVQLCEALFDRREKIYLKFPETQLHPATTRLVMTTLAEAYRLILHVDLTAI